MVYQTKRALTLLLILLDCYFILGVTGCSVGNQPRTPTPKPTGVIIPFSSHTPTIPSNPILIGTDNVPNTPKPTITATPILYQIVEGDTLSSIAHRFGVKLSDLISMNPTINPNFLTIGISLTIPITGNNPTTLLKPTPIPISLETPKCYPQADGGLACVSAVINNQEFDIENVTAQVSISSLEDNKTYFRETITPINFLTVGMQLPIFVYFPPPIPETYQTNVKITSVLPVEGDRQRYIPLNTEISTVNISETKHQATIIGSFSPINQDQIPGQVWVLAVAYDSQRNSIGYRKWLSKSPMSEGNKQSFIINVYSLGPPIEEVDVFFEAVP